MREIGRLLRRLLRCNGWAAFKGGYASLRFRRDRLMRDKCETSLTQEETDHFRSIIPD